MGNVNNNIYPVNARRLTSADMIPIFGSFINDDRAEQGDLVYAITTGRVKSEYNNGTVTLTEYQGLDDKFVVIDSSENKIFKYNDSGKPFNDERGGTGDSNTQNKQDEIDGYRYNGWNLLKSTGDGKIKIIKGRNNNDQDVILFPELDVSTYDRTATRGINDWRKDYGNYKDTLITTINEWSNGFVSDTSISYIVNYIQTNLLSNKVSNTDAASYYNNSNFFGDLEHTLRNIRTQYDPDSTGVNTGAIKSAYANFVDHLCTSLIDDIVSPINASMLRPEYEFDSDVLPDTNFRCMNGIYNYRKFYSYQYNNWYYQHVNFWWRPWYWSWSYYWWWPHRWWHCYAWFWHSWWWYYWYYPLYWYGTSNTNVGETVTMCNVFKYNNYYPNEYIPIDPQKYIENNNIGDNSSANSAKFRKYIDYLTSTYKSNIYKINSYIKDVNKMVDKIVAVCDYIIYDNDNTIVQGADINYNIIYDKYQRIDLDDNNHALPDSSLGGTTNSESFQNLVNNDFGSSHGLNDGADQNYEQPISEFSIVNGIDITRIKLSNGTYVNKARQYFPIKPIYLLICPKTQNNTNKIIKYKVNLYQYGNIKTDSILTFVMYQMPKLITVKFKFNCGGYNLRKDTFGILGNVNNSSPSNSANVNIITNAEFDEAETRDYHMSKKMHLEDNTYAQNNLNTPYKYGLRRFYNGTSTIESVVNQEYDKYRERKTVGINNWPTYEEGELPILALNDQDHIVVFLSSLAYDTGQDDYNNFFNSSAYVTFQLYTEDYSSYVTVTMSGHKTLFKGNNIYGASNNNTSLHWGSNITGLDFKAYPDVKSWDTYRNNNANVMFSHLYGYRIYLKHWYTLQQTSTQEIAVNGKRLKITFVWTVLPVAGNRPDGSPFWTTGTP